VLPPQNGLGAAAIKQLTDTIDSTAKSLATLTKAHAATLGELATLKKSVPGSNALPVGSGRTPVQSTAWPIDMNGRKAGTSNEDSFLDP
jgi:hypothetical protein